jgi:hypothetical protein
MQQQLENPNQPQLKVWPRLKPKDRQNKARHRRINPMACKWHEKKFEIGRDRRYHSAEFFHAIAAIDSSTDTRSCLSPRREPSRRRQKTGRRPEIDQMGRVWICGSF